MLKRSQSFDYCSVRVSVGSPTRLKGIKTDLVNQGLENSNIQGILQLAANHEEQMEGGLSPSRRRVSSSFRNNSGNPGTFKEIGS